MFRQWRHDNFKAALVKPNELMLLPATLAKVGPRSFARDGGLPYSSWLSQVRPGLDV